jgi:thioesterase domain-containing protein
MMLSLTAMVLPGATEFRWARQRRATARQADGLLDTVLPLRTEGAGHPLFCVYPVMGLSWCYLALRPHIGERHPMYGLQSRGLGGPEALPATMRDTARDFAEEIRRTQPEGPYHLLGWSLGGNVAFAIAEELQRRGQRVALLALLDTSPVVTEGLSADDRHRWLRCNFVLAEFGYDTPLKPDEAEPEARMLAFVRGRPGLLHDWSDERIRALLTVMKHNVELIRGYSLGRIDASLLFVSATKHPPATAAKVARWQSHVDGRIDTIEVDCEHQHMLLPEPIARIGAAVTARLADLDG